MRDHQNQLGQLRSQLAGTGFFAFGDKGSIKGAISYKEGELAAAEGKQQQVGGELMVKRSRFERISLVYGQSAAVDLSKVNSDLANARQRKEDQEKAIQRLEELLK